jgi:hypothetical protein
MMRNTQRLRIKTISIVTVLMIPLVWASSSYFERDPDKSSEKIVSVVSDNNPLIEIESSRSPSVRAPTDQASRTTDTQEILHDGKILREYGDFVPVQITYQNCRDTAAGFRCDTAIVFDHPYNDFTHDQLLSMVQFDAVAAYILGHRIFYGGEYKKFYGDTEWYQAGTNYLIDSAILSKESQPYQTMLAGRNLVGLSKIDGRLDMNHARESYVWRKAGYELSLLSADAARLESIKQRIAQNRFENDGVDFDAWNAEATALKNYVLQRQAALTGDKSPTRQITGEST